MRSIRPIGITTTFMKYYEYWIIKDLRKEVEGKLNQSQYGFRKGRECAMHTTSILQKIISRNENGNKKKRPGEDQILFVDFSGAFDCINHNKLFDKMNDLEVDIETINNTAWYLNNIWINNGEEGGKSVRLGKGSPQGSKISPIL